MDLFILTSAKDRSQAAITSATDTTALEGPDDFQQLVVGTTEPLTVKHLTGASAYESWTADPAYTVVAALGAISAEGRDVYTSATLSTVITNGKSGNLALTTAALADALALGSARPFRPPYLYLTLQITVTDSSGYKHVYAQLPVRVNGTVPTFTQT